MKLTAKQAAFVREYLVDLNATQAAIRAGYSSHRADAIGYENLRKPELARAIQEAMDKRSEKVEITSDRVLTEIGKLAFADIRKIFNEHGQLLPAHMLPDEIAASVASIEVVTKSIPGQDGEAADVEHTSKIKFWDKRGSLELLGRHLKLFTDKIEVDVGEGLAARIKEARERAKAG